MTDPAILTVGHSTHPLEEFLTLLQQAAVGMIVDVRRLPGSNRYPWFNQDALSASLGGHGIRYAHLAELAGRRPIQRDVPDEVNALWRNRSFHNYADYAMGTQFSHSLEALIERADPQHPPAVMCSEAVWWRCHRRLIADHLIARGLSVGHLMPDGRIADAELTPGAVARDGGVQYPAATWQASAGSRRQQ